MKLSRNAIVFLIGCTDVTPPIPVHTDGPAPVEPADAAQEDSGPAPPYTIPAFDRIRIGSHSTDEHFQSARTAIDFAGAPFAQVRMHVALDTTCFPFELWQTDPPPQGHNFPEDCDAFDRNFDLLLRRDDRSLDLLRAITPFGGPLDLDVDVTDIANGLPGLHELEVHVSTWSDPSGRVSGAHGGWFVSVSFEVVPGAAPRNVLAVEPLFRFSVASTSTDAFAFEAPDGTTSGRIEFRATGHGGGEVQTDCIGPAEEFCRRRFDIMIDGGLETIDPWRTNCVDLCTIAHYGPTNGGFDYCAENPTGSIASVRAPRANWCPGSVTEPFVFAPEALGTPGPHTLQWLIRSYSDRTWPGIPPRGSWILSATYFAYGDP
jgi:hypothetical protein